MKKYTNNYIKCLGLTVYLHRWEQHLSNIRKEIIQLDLRHYGNKYYKRYLYKHYKEEEAFARYIWRDLVYLFGDWHLDITEGWLCVAPGNRYEIIAFIDDIINQYCPANI